MTPEQGRTSGRGDAAEPMILTLAAGRPASVAGIVASLVERQAALHDPAVRIAVDARDAHGIVADPAILFDLLEPLLGDAFTAAAGPMGDTDGPSLREVDVTTVATADALEIEIADSGAERTPGQRISERVRDAAARCGASVSVQRCAAGGTAVTVRLPRRAARRLAA